MNALNDNRDFFWTEKSAKEGDVSAQFNLATMYDDGVGVAHDRGQAVYWYSKAIEQGHTGAQDRMS
ncbi:MAG: hypothetical protein Ctma_1239 [Catillopecten margaritatus gill symbiont]|uniref:Sel1 repeat family protein n=1 Tax=Catillopecten margaritatus gill symbiont TaxID=3083288 RepID=A0AAU6PHN2_9GAMM